MREKEKKNNPAYNVFLLTNQEKAHIFLTLFSIVTRVKDLKKKTKKCSAKLVYCYWMVLYCFSHSLRA